MLLHQHNDKRESGLDRQEGRGYGLMDAFGLGLGTKKTYAQFIGGNEGYELKGFKEKGKWMKKRDVEMCALCYTLPQMLPKFK